VAGLLRKTLDKYPGKVAAIGISYGPYDADEKEAWKYARKEVKIDWPVGLDLKERYVDRLFPDGGRPSFVLIGKDGKRRNDTLSSIEDLPTLVGRLVAERK
jgi:hypothetical protein